MTTINELKTQLKGGLRKNKYQIIFSPPGNFISSEKLNLLCKSAAFPERAISVAEVTHYGRRYYLRGDTTYSGTWNVSFYDDANMNIRRIFDYWMVMIDNSRKTIQAAPMAGKITEDYQREIEIWQLDANQNQVYGSVIHNAFPVNLESITYDDSETDSLVECNVTFQFSEFEPVSNMTIDISNSGIV